MVMYFPRPYPDELIGSVIARACIHLGRRAAKLPGSIGSCQSSSRAFYLPSDLTLLAQLTGLDAQYLLDQHTIFPYLCAFMSPADVSKMTEKILAARAYDREIVPSSLVKPLRPTNKAFRCCPSCIKDDTRRFGESYWHRAHQLPCIYLCPVHKEPLFQAKPTHGEISRSTFSCGTPTMDHMEPSSPPIPLALLEKLDRYTTGTLAPDWQHREDWTTLYREQAGAKGYHLTNEALAGRQMAIDLQRFYGEPTLQFLHCLIAKRIKAAWPALMLRLIPSTVGPFSALKHILLIAFLTHCDTRVAKPEYRPRGTSPRNCDKEDANCTRHIRKCWNEAKRKGTRLKISEMLGALGLYKRYQHHPERFPKTAALLSEFSRSGQAVWQIGCRPRNSKRLDVNGGKPRPHGPRSK